MNIMDTIEQCNTIKNTQEQLKFILSNFDDFDGEYLQVKIFIDTLSHITSKFPCILELGSGGTDASFYSIIFEKYFTGNCKIINTDPRKGLLDNVLTKWKDKFLTNAILLWGYNGEYKNYQQNLPIQELNNAPNIPIKSIIENYVEDKIDVLHMDIQGSETSILNEIINDNLYSKIDFMFINTHKLEEINTFDLCLKLLTDKFNCKFLFQNKYYGGCGDGLIVCKNIKE